MRRIWIVSGFLVLCAVQLAVPGWMIGGREATLANGVLYKFRTAPVDPYDAFRGRYVALRYDVERSPLGEQPLVHPETRVGGNAYALLGTDREGFAVVRELTPRPPEQGDYLKVRITGSRDPVRFRLPFDRFYMEESRAPAAGRVYRRRGRNGVADRRRDPYVVVRIWRGISVIEELYVDGKPIGELLADERSE